MTRNFLSSFMLAAVAMTAGCAALTSKPAETTPQTQLDAIITKYAAEATLALRELSENTGATKMVTTGGRNQAAATSPAGSTSIAGRMGSVAVSAAVTSVQPLQTGPDSVTGPLATAMSVPPGLERLVTMKWTGDLESLILVIGKETGWRVNEPTGFRVSPVIIALNADKRAAFEVLKDVGAIAGTAADVVISVPNKTLTVAYPTRKN